MFVLSRFFLFFKRFRWTLLAFYFNVLEFELASISIVATPNTCNGLASRKGRVTRSPGICISNTVTDGGNWSISGNPPGDSCSWRQLQDVHDFKGLFLLMYPRRKLTWVGKTYLFRRHKKTYLLSSPLLLSLLISLSLSLSLGWQHIHTRASSMTSPKQAQRTSINTGKSLFAYIYRHETASENT